MVKLYGHNGNKTIVDSVFSCAAVMTKTFVIPGDDAQTNS